MAAPIPSGVAPCSQLALFDWSAGFGLVGATDDWWGDQNQERQGVPITVRWATLYLWAVRVIVRGRCPLVQAEHLALAELSLRYAANAATEHKATGEVRRFFRFLRAHGVEWIDDVSAEHVAEFVWAASRHRGRFADVSATTAANRQSFLRTLFATLTALGVGAAGDVVGSPIRRDDGESSRPLSDAELHRVHVHACGGLLVGRRPLLVAFAEAGGDATEIATVRGEDVDLDAETVRFTGRAERVNRLSPWSVEAVARVIAAENLWPCELLCASGRIPVERAAHSITVQVRDVLRDAGLAGKPGVTAKSIRLTAARRLLDATGIEAAARFLGNDSLDATARALTHQWWER